MDKLKDLIINKYPTWSVEVRELESEVVISTTYAKEAMREYHEKMLEEEGKLYERVSFRLNKTLKEQKEFGKQFISDESIDILIDEIIKKELNK